jgi:hypothetical protein
LDELPHPPVIFPVRVQMLLHQTPPGTLRHIVQRGEVYLVPRASATATKFWTPAP